MVQNLALKVLVVGVLPYRGAVPTTTLTFCCSDHLRTTCAVETLYLAATSYQATVEMSRLSVGNDIFVLAVLAMKMER
jgi:hypothetical protein